MKTAELTGAHLNWAVAKAIGEYSPTAVPEYSTDWAHGGPIIEREWDNLLRWFYLRSDRETGDMWPDYMLNGRPVLTAFMQAYVALKLGDEVYVADELKEEIA